MGKNPLACKSKKLTHRGSKICQINRVSPVSQDNMDVDVCCGNKHVRAVLDDEEKGKRIKLSDSTAQKCY